MIDKTKFFEKKRRCPVCNKKLSLYLLISDYGTFKDQTVKGQDENVFSFKPITNNELFYSARMTPADFIDVNLIDDINFSLSFSSEGLFRIIESSKLSFFYLCNEDAVKPGENYIGMSNNYEISNYEMCYYKLSNNLFFKYINDKYILSTENLSKNPTSLEVFSTSQSDNKKHYCLVYDYNKDKTNFYFFSGTSKAPEFYEHQFTKEFPILNYYPDFKDKEKIMNRFDSWILIS